MGAAGLQLGLVCGAHNQSTVPSINTSQDRSHHRASNMTLVPMGSLKTLPAPLHATSTARVRETKAFEGSINSVTRDYESGCVEGHKMFHNILQWSQYPCSGMLGMVSGLITDNQISASSHTDRSWVPENARLLTSRTGWTLLPQPQPFTNEWLQVDLGEEKLVKGFIIQGGKYRENKVFMKKFRLGYSNNGSDWRMAYDASGNKPKVGWGILRINFAFVQF
ncbi:hypothetical protein GOODEAATRI_001378 [Goodea atripinnis]|uniref:F5/8 type C domain-containing protein n=1 Tax=Goodea atripinnis TaxID=208336 RepID=A0ABV0NGQ3_9TELE